jgi:hypothetical protein
MTRTLALAYPTLKGRVRSWDPFADPTLSFPAGHSMASAAIAIRCPIAPEIEQRIRDALRARESMRKIAARLGISTNTVLKVSRGPFEASAAAA